MPHRGSNYNYVSGTPCNTDIVNVVQGDYIYDGTASNTAGSVAWTGFNDRCRASLPNGRLCTVEEVRRYSYAMGSGR